jgi:hypothetical protein
MKNKMKSSFLAAGESFKKRFDTYQKKIGIIIFSLVIVYLVANSVLKQENNSHQYFSDALRKANIRETVTVHGELYAIEDGSVTRSNPEIDNKNAVEALRLAYAKTLAKRNPFFALSGVELIRLDEAIQALSETRYNLAQLQESEKQKRAILFGLYPLRYLNALSNAEKKRRAFIDSGSDVDEKLYRESLRTIPTAYSIDSFRFERAFKSIVPKQISRYATERTIISRTNTISTIRSLRSRIGKTQQQMEAQYRCIDGETMYCEDRSLRLPIIIGLLDEHEYESPYLTITKEFYTTVGIFNGEEQIVSIYNNACLENRELTTNFALRPSQTNKGLIGATILNDVRLINIDQTNNTPFFRHFREAGLTYLPINQFNYYGCAEFDRDVGKIFATLAVSTFASETPLSTYTKGSLQSELQTIEKKLAEQKKLELFSTKYLLKAEILLTQNHLPQDITDKLIDLMLQTKNNSVGFERVISSIAATEDRNIQLKEKNVAPVILATQLFFARSGYAALNMNSNESFGTSVELFDKNVRALTGDPFIYLSSLEESNKEYGKAISDARIYFQIHGDL